MKTGTPQLEEHYWALWGSPGLWRPEMEAFHFEHTPLAWGSEQPRGIRIWGLKAKGPFEYFDGVSDDIVLTGECLEWPQD